MANNDYITTDCKLTVSKNTAKLDEEIFLYKNDKNIKLLIEIVDNKYRYKSDDLSNLLVKYKASYAQVKWYKNAEVKKEFPIQATDDGKVVFVIEGQLIDEDTELGDYDLQLRLLNESQESIRSLPIIKSAVHILKPLFEESDIATVNSAVADVSMLSLDGDTIDTYNSDGTYNQTNWTNGDVISSAKLNKLEKVAKDNVDKVNKMPAKSIVEGGKIYLTKEDGTKLDSGTELPVGGSTIEVVNNLESDSTTAALSAAQGKALNTQYKDIVSQLKDILGRLGVLEDYHKTKIYSIPLLKLTGNTTGIGKDAPVTMDNCTLLDVYGKPIFENLKCSLEYQGASSLNYPKKNYSIDLKNADGTKYKHKFFDDVAACDGFHLKADYVDVTRSKNVVSCKLFKYMNEKQLPNNARGVIDGFPIMLEINGEAQGIYAFNLKQNKDLFNMSKTNVNNIVFRACDDDANSPNTSNEFRKLETNTKEGTLGWEERFPKTYSNENMAKLNRLIQWVMDCENNANKFKTEIDQYLDKDFLIDYWLFVYLSGHYDGLSNNMTLATWDGLKWYALVYDLDGTWGFHWGQPAWATTFRCPEDYGNYRSLLWQLTRTVFKDDIKNRWQELRNNKFTYEKIVAFFDNYCNQIGEDNYKTDITLWPNTLSKEHNLSAIKTWIKGRLEYMDSQILNSSTDPTEPVYTKDAYMSIAKVKKGDDTTIYAKEGTTVYAPYIFKDDNENTIKSINLDITSIKSDKSNNISLIIGYENENKYTTIQFAYGQGLGYIYEIVGNDSATNNINIANNLIYTDLTDKSALNITVMSGKLFINDANTYENLCVYDFAENTSIYTKPCLGLMLKDTICTNCSFTYKIINNIPTTSIELKDMQIGINSVGNIPVTIKPLAHTDNPSILYSCNPEGIITINTESNTITGVSEGTTTLTGKISGNENITDSCTITCTKLFSIKPTTIKKGYYLDNNNNEISSNKNTYILEDYVNVENKTNLNIRYIGTDKDKLTALRVCEYDINKQFVQRQFTTTDYLNWNITLASTTKFIRLSIEFSTATEYQASDFAFTL